MVQEHLNFQSEFGKSESYSVHIIFLLMDATTLVLGFIWRLAINKIDPVTPLFIEKVRS